MGLEINDNITIYDNTITQEIEMYLEDNGLIDPEQKRPNITANEWHACLIYVGNILFKDKSILRIEPYLKINSNPNNMGMTNNGKYDIDKINCIYNIYKYICMKYNQRICINHFTDLLGISNEYIYNLRDKADRDQNASIAGIDFYKKIKNDSETSLENLLLDKSINPMKILPILNNRFGWADKRTVVEHDTQRIAPKSRTDILAEFGQSAIETVEK